MNELICKVMRRGSILMHRKPSVAWLTKVMWFYKLECSKSKWSHLKLKHFSRVEKSIQMTHLFKTPSDAIIINTTYIRTNLEIYNILRIHHFVQKRTKMFFNSTWYQTLLIYWNTVAMWLVFLYFIAATTRCISCSCEIWGQ